MVWNFSLVAMGIAPLNTPCDLLGGYQERKQGCYVKVGDINPLERVQRTPCSLYESTVVFHVFSDGLKMTVGPIVTAANHLSSGTLFWLFFLHCAFFMSS